METTRAAYINGACVTSVRLLRKQGARKTAREPNVKMLEAQKPTQLAYKLKMELIWLYTIPFGFNKASN